MYNDRIKNLHQRLLRLEKIASQSEEDRFFDNPLAKSVRQFAESEAISNDVSVSENASKSMVSEKTETLLKSESVVAPPTPSEIKKKPGGSEFSTLTQFVLETEEKVKTPPVESAKKPPESLEEGMQDLAEKVKERDVSRRDKLKAIKEVMKKKSSQQKQKVYRIKRR